MKERDGGPYVVVTRKPSQVVGRWMIRREVLPREGYVTTTGRGCGEGIRGDRGC